MKIFRKPFPKRQLTMMRIARLRRKQKILEEKFLLDESLKKEYPELEIDEAGDCKIIEERVQKLLELSAGETNPELSQQYLEKALNSQELVIEELEKINEEISERAVVIMHRKMAKIADILGKIDEGVKREMAKKKTHKFWMHLR